MISPGNVLALTATTTNLPIAAVQFALARAPGWRIARVYGAMALTAGLYSLVNIVYSVADLPVGVYLAAGRLSYLLGGLQAVLWFVYAYADDNGSLQTAPRWVKSAPWAAAAAATFLAATGWLLQERVSPVVLEWAGVTYYYPLTTMLGDVYALLGEKQNALRWLRRAVELGNHNYPWFSKDKNWDKLRGDAQYEKIMADVRARWESYKKEFGIT